MKWQECEKYKINGHVVPAHDSGYKFADYYLDEHSEDDAMWFNKPSKKQEILRKKMRCAVKAMSGRKYEVWTLLLNGKSLTEIATILNMSKATVQTYYKRGAKEIKTLVNWEGETNE